MNTYPYCYDSAAANSKAFFEHLDYAEPTRANLAQTYSSSTTATFYNLSGFPTDPFFDANYFNFEYPVPDSPGSSRSGTTLPESESSYAAYLSEFTSSPPPNLHRSSSYPSPAGMPTNSAVRRAEVHKIYRLECNTDETIQNNVHRLNDKDKRSLDVHSFPPGTERPNYYCKVPGCRQPWIYNGTQIKEHLTTQHNMVFRKPWACSCGSQFGRPVEADRHLEDQRPCGSCGLPGRKLKGYANGSICHRCQKRQLNSTRQQ